MGLIFGFMQFFGAAPNIAAIAKAKVAGKTIFDVIDRIPEIKDNE